MSDLTMFSYEGAELRTLTIDGEPWFSAPDACQMLGLRDTTSALKMVDSDDKQRLCRSDTPHFFGAFAPQVQTFSIVNESGMYALIFQSRKDQARKVKRWVTGEVLPQIRKTGSYSPPLSDDEIVHRALQLTYRKVQELEAKVAEDAPKVAYHDVYVADEDLIQFRTLANQLEVGEKHLRQVLMARGWIYRRDYQRWSNKKDGLVTEYQWRAVADKKRYFRLIPAHDAPRLAGEVRQTLKVTPAGAVAIERAMRRWAAEDVAA